MVASKSKKGKSQSTHRARSRSAQKSVKKDDKTKKSRSRSSSSRSRSQKRRRRSSSRKRSKSSSRSRSRSRSQRRSRSKSKKRDRKKRKSSHSRKRSRSRRKSRSRSRRGKKEKDKEEAVKVEKKESKQDLTIEEKAAILAKVFSHSLKRINQPTVFLQEMAATQLLMAERRERVKLEASKVAMTIKNELAKKAGGFGMNFDGTHACELEINDYPQHARFKGTHRKTFDTVFDLTEATVTTKGTWVPPGRNAMHGERKLYLSIKGTTEASVRSAKQELLRILKEAAMEAKPTKELYSKYAVMFS